MQTDFSSRDDLTDDSSVTELPTAMPQAARGVQRLMLLALLLLAFILRVYRLGDQSLWYDEAVTAQVASQGIAELTRWTADDIQPPLYYYAVAGWTRLAGRGEWALRFPSAAFGVLTVGLLAAAARRLFGRGRTGQVAARAAALLAALSPLYVYYAQEARMYTLLVFLGLLAGYALLRAAGERRSGGAEGRRSRGAEERRGEGDADVAGGATAGESVRSNDFSRSARATATKVATTNPPIFRADAGGWAFAHWWVVFVLAAAAMLYTHYFGAFLLAAYGLCWLVGWLAALRPDPRAILQGGSRPASPAGEGGGGLPSRLPFPRREGAGGAAKHLPYALLSFLAVILLYLPWLPAMLNRYGVDRSYWPGALKLDEALRHVAISFTTGAPETMLEADAVRWLPWCAAAFVVAAAAGLLRKWERGTRGSAGKTGRSLRLPLFRSPDLVLLATLIVPTVAILLLASRTPKFNPRYLMLVSPAYLLIVAGGVGALGGGAGERGSGGAEGRRRRGAEEQRSGGTRNTQYVTRITHHASRIIPPLLLSGFFVAVSLLGLRNWFADPAFTKAQWREAAAAVRAQRAPDEAVLLVSGHASPAWDYYAGDIPRTRLPDLDILDVNAVLGFDTGAALAGALAGKGGVWLVSWQDDVVDPAGFVPYFLDRAGTEQPVAARFWHLGLRHWRLNAGAAFPPEPRPAHALGANFDHKLALLGWDDPQDGQLTVYWRTLNTLPADYQVSLILEDARGREVGRWDGRPAGYGYPTTRWRPGQALFGRYPLPLPSGATTGDYSVTIAVYDAGDPSGLDIRDVADNPAGKRARLGPIHGVR